MLWCRLCSGLLQALGLNPSETTAMALRRRQILLRLCLKGKKALVSCEHNVVQYGVIQYSVIQYSVRSCCGSA